MACFAAFFRKKKRGDLRISRSQDQSPIQSPTVGAYWEFSYFYYNEESRKFEKAEACQLKPPGKRKELLLFVTCIEKKPSAVKLNMLQKDAAVSKVETAAICHRCNTGENTPHLEFHLHNLARLGGPERMHKSSKLD